MPDNLSTEARDFLTAIEALCGEANEGARLAEVLFEGSQQREVRRAFARCMELMEQDVLPHFHAKFPQLRGSK
jgi:hypothetical protein